mgnify:CR=1 FL=1
MDYRQTSGTHLQQPEPLSNDAVPPDESEEDFARMRELLQSTQDEVDRIIQGSNNI